MTDMLKPYTRLYSLFRGVKTLSCVLNRENFNYVRQQIRVPRVRLISVPITLEERFVRFSCVALPYFQVQVRYLYGDIR